jgi:hypothetical protein
VSTSRTALAVAAGVAAWLVMAAAVSPAAAQGTPVGTAQNAVGTLVVVRTDGIEARLQGRGALPLYEGDVLRTEPGSQALIQLRPGMPVALNEKTTLKILSRWEKEKTGNITRVLRVSQGQVWAKAGDGVRQLEIETPAAVAAARDSEFDLKVGEDGQGTAELDTPFGVCPVRGGTASTGARGATCSAPQPANVSAAATWKQAVAP